MAKKQEFKEPPVMLVQTWYDLLNNKDSKELQKSGQDKLLRAFNNDPQAIADYLKLHKIIE
ncbi:hypothetical protein [Paraglaciecola sp. MB-3u-78]|jgi:hypothetical protein|uniref:hypothetical protein n=1 Tax=Paraglaciecola sp. MB-3u-78 TaxID=2058332 RepID=UPI000C32FF83|nr:hypothetical protein [Paraglaciecola sp. MB-3u-78]PKG96968.1 hypothetical protein CXF95_21920 [Paraglaciecola sp. MB-3u-78]